VVTRLGYPLGQYICEQMTKTRKRGFGFACLLVLFAVAASLGYACRGNGEAAYRSSLRTLKLSAALQSISRRLPLSIAYPFRYLGDAAFRHYHAQDEALLTSGYLTNISITLTNASAAFTNAAKTPGLAEIRQRFCEAVPDNVWWPFALCRDNQSNLVTVEITCRSNDVPACMRALERY
jgi:hypothetical protein